MDSLTHSIMSALYASLAARRRPEDVAELVVRLLERELTGAERAVLEVAARGSLSRRWLGYTSMREAFAAPTTMDRQIRRATDLFVDVPSIATVDAASPESIEGFLRAISPEIDKAFGANDFLHDRLDGAGREARGLSLSRRRYNRKFRLLRRMEAKLARMVREQRKLEFTRVGKSGLASSITREDFMTNQSSAAFVAYYVARANLRSEFTVWGQQRPYDQVADMLFRRCLTDSNASFSAIAHVYPTEQVLARLTDAQKGSLLARWHELLVEIGSFLGEVYRASDMRADSMVVRRGNDSTTWNNTVRAWNTARAHWIALLHAMGAEQMLEVFCPGKAMALIAGDVAAWHHAVGHHDNPELRVFAALPRPWDVLEGRATCGRVDVELACRRAAVDPETSGWTAPRRPAVVAFRATPELVHGVAVESARLATLLRRAGFFSGKEFRPT